MKRTAVLGVVIVLSITAAYFAGIRSAQGTGDPCYSLTDPVTACGSCSDTICGGCSGGACTGEAKVCRQTFTVTSDLPTGFDDIEEIMPSCWQSYYCRTVIPSQPCGSTNACVMNVGRPKASSMSYFSTFRGIGTGECGSPLSLASSADTTENRVEVRVGTSRNR